MSDYDALIGEDYNRLYAKYLERPSQLLVAPDPAVALNEHTHLLDLCSGSGAVVKAAIGMGVKAANIVAVEESETMALRIRRASPVRVIHKHLGYLGLYKRLAKHGPYDLITCRQAVNYWWHCELAEAIVGLLAPGGCFVFNTFNTKPADVPQVKQYVYEDHQFAEIAYCIDGIVHHAQAREGMSMHLTTFKWVDPVEFAITLDSLKTHGNILSWELTIDGTTDTYVVRAHSS